MKSKGSGSHQERKRRPAAAAVLVKKQKRAAAAEQKRIEAEQCAKEERELEIAVKHEYASVLEYMATESIKKKRVLGDHDDKMNSKTKNLLRKSSNCLSCPAESILSHAQRGCAPTALDRN